MLRNILVLLVAVLTVTVTAQGMRQGKGRMGMRPVSVEDRVKHINQAIGLNDAQYAAVTKIIEASEKEVQELRSSKQPGTQPNFEKMQQIRLDEQKKISALLTPEQLKLYEVFVEKNKRERPLRRGRGPANTN